MSVREYRHMARRVRERETPRARHGPRGAYEQGDGQGMKYGGMCVWETVRTNFFTTHTIASESAPRRGCGFLLSNSHVSDAIRRLSPFHAPILLPLSRRANRSRRSRRATLILAGRSGVETRSRARGGGRGPAAGERTRSGRRAAERTESIVSRLSYTLT
jgi:hypothetical protein